MVVVVVDDVVVVVVVVDVVVVVVGCGCCCGCCGCCCGCWLWLLFLLLVVVVVVVEVVVVVVVGCGCCWSIDRNRVSTLMVKLLCIHVFFTRAEGTELRFRLRFFVFFVSHLICKIMQDFCACVLRDARFQNGGHNTLDIRCSLL